VHAWAYLPDLARAFVAWPATAATAAACACTSRAMHVTGPEFIAALDEAAASLGLRPAAGFGRRHALGLIRVIGLVHPMMRELARMSYLWRVPHALDGRALQQLSGRCRPRRWCRRCGRRCSAWAWGRQPITRYRRDPLPRVPRLSLLDVTDLRVTLTTARGPADALRGVSFSLARGDTSG
jgi:hypothetical protein